MCKEYTSQSFPILNCCSVEDLSYYYNEKIQKQLNGDSVENPINLSTFNRILKITLKNNSQIDVLNAIERLNDVDLVDSAEPCSLIELDLLATEVKSRITNDPYSYIQWVISNIN